MTFRHTPRHRRELEPFEKRGDYKLPLTEAKRVQLQRQLGSHVTMVGFDVLNAMGEDLHVPMTQDELVEFKERAKPIIETLRRQYGPRTIESTE